MQTGIGSAPGKVIIAGEHSVVFGFPAIAASLGLRCIVRSSLSDHPLHIFSIDMNIDFVYSTDQIISLETGELIHGKFDAIAMAAIRTLKELNQPLGIKLEISSLIPISAGLGSSAAVVVATIASILNFYDSSLELDKISAIGFESEKITHGNPSGIDNSIATYGGILRFENGNIVRKTLNHSIPLLIGNTKIHRDTKKLVSGVAERRSAYPKIMDELLESMSKIANEVEKTIETGDLIKLGQLFDINQGLLDAIGVGHPVLSQYVWEARKSNALGAKLTGAGGGGCMIILTNEKDKESIATTLSEKGMNIIATNLSSDGVIIGGE